MGASLYPPPVSPIAGAIVSESAELADTPLVGTTETVAYTHTFTAVAGRRYRVRFQAASVDTDLAGSDYTSKGSARVCMRWAVGTSAASGSFFAEQWIPTFGDNSERSSGITFFGHFTASTSGTHAVAVTINQQFATGGNVRFIMYGNGNKIVIEDAGPA
ncbi:hypothetical protein KGG73_gp18 [Streptomyces phage Sentinel]|uniref:DUF7298 domain-containing protein n=1 Tax=Streptomyces phage Sentinel TaxID=2767584 RepID=A0A873WLJ1_9CAUD|nr:hypothetical protein KGG73_gp18 [Streptomyces phage Sentinel]QPB09852.1 hypothetical protein CPT_Sentinel_018 [Streptomyces phage Sentinel]